MEASVVISERVLKPVLLDEENEKETYSFFSKLTVKQKTKLSVLEKEKVLNPVAKPR